MFFAMQKTDFHEFEFFAESQSELNCTKSFFIASKNTNSVLVQMMSLIAQNHFFIASKNTNSVLVQMMRLRGHGCSKTSPQREKLLNAILRVKLKNMKMFLSNEMKCFLQCRRQIS